MIFDVSHRTTYRYRKPVLQSKHLLHMSPRTLLRQSVLRHTLLIEPAPDANVPIEDYFGNHAAILTIESEHSELVIHARSRVEVNAPDLPLPALSAPWEQVMERARLADGGLDIDVLQFISASRHTAPLPEAMDYAAPSFAPGRPVLEAVLDLTLRIYRDFSFDSSATDISTPVSQVLTTRRGVCQDFAHLALTCLRGLRLPARYDYGPVRQLLDRWLPDPADRARVLWAADGISQNDDERRILRALAEVALPPAVTRIASTPSARAIAVKSTAGSAKSMPMKWSPPIMDFRRCLMMR